MNEVNVTNCTKARSLKKMQKSLVKELNNMQKNNGYLEVVTTTLDGGGIGCDLEYMGGSKGISFVDVKFSDEESIVNFILHSVANSHCCYVKINVSQIDNDTVSLRVEPENASIH